MSCWARNPLASIVPGGMPRAMVVKMSSRARLARCVSRVALRVEPSCGRIDVCGGGFIGDARKGAAAEGDSASLRVADREDHAAFEAVVVTPSPLAFAEQADDFQDFR